MVDLPPDPISMTIAIMTSPLFLKIAIFPGLTSIGIIAAVLTWLDRKITARVQLRIGPQYVSPFGGILQSFADLIKLAFKELIIPEKADRFFFVLAPVFGLVLGAGLVGLIPFSPETLISNVEVGLPVFLAFVTLSPTLVLLAGWSANSKYPFIGGLRSLFQQTGYEIPLWLSSLGVVMMAGSFNLTKIIQAQSTGWFIIPQLLGAIIFLVTSVAEQERIPFDLPEAEPEIIMGWQAEYPGFLFLAAQGAGFVKLYAFSALFTTIYLGGYLGPGPLPPLFWSLFKTTIMVVLVILLRGAFGRVRLDQLLRYGWTLLLGLAIVNIGITYFLIVGFPTI
jgi:NADH-quinone oxidoreductase subunit H